MEKIGTVRKTGAGHGKTKIDDNNTIKWIR